MVDCEERGRGGVSNKRGRGLRGGTGGGCLGAGCLSCSGGAQFVVVAITFLTEISPPATLRLKIMVFKS